MSEVINKRNSRNDFRWHLLTTVSALGLATSVCMAAQASDPDAPSIWIELGGQTEWQTGQGDPLVPAFVANDPTAAAFQGFDLLRAQKASPFSTGLEGKVTYQPDGTDWVFSAGILYGRANSSRNLNHNTPGHVVHNKGLYFTYPPSVPHYRTYAVPHCCVTHTQTRGGGYANIQTSSRQSHAVIDFQAGRDVGLGLFGHDASSVVSAGVRFVQFISRSDTTIHARPTVTLAPYVHHFEGLTYTNYRLLPRHLYQATAASAHSFHGIGPTVSWNGSMPFLGNAQVGEVALDFGANAAILFGRQKAASKHQTYGVSGYGNVTYTHTGNVNRQRTVVVPNVGGLAGVSFKFTTVKVSVGYRGDFFFGAMDTGIDTRKTKTVGFYGPFASVSIGIGG